jgi:hypothetical protein
VHIISDHRGARCLVSRKTRLLCCHLEKPDLPDGSVTPALDASFDVPAFPNEIFRVISVRDPFNILFDNRPFIEFGRHVMGCCAYQFDTPLVGLMIGSRALETRQERVMDGRTTSGPY